MIYTTSLYPSAPSPILALVLSIGGYVVPMGILPRFGKMMMITIQQHFQHQIGQELSALPPNTVPKKFSPNDVYNTADVIESKASFTCDKNPEKNGLRCWNIPF